MFITTFLTREGSRLIPRPVENGNEASRLFINLTFRNLECINFMLARLLYTLASHELSVVNQCNQKYTIKFKELTNEGETYPRTQAHSKKSPIFSTGLGMRQGETVITLS